MTKEELDVLHWDRTVFSSIEQASIARQQWLNSLKVGATVKAREAKYTVVYKTQDIVELHGAGPDLAIAHKDFLDVNAGWPSLRVSPWTEKDEEEANLRRRYEGILDKLRRTAVTETLCRALEQTLV